MAHFGGAVLSRLAPEIEATFKGLASSHQQFSRLVWRAAALVNTVRRLGLDNGGKLRLQALDAPEVVCPNNEGFARACSLTSDEAAGSVLLIPTHIRQNYAPRERLAQRIAVVLLLALGAPIPRFVGDATQDELLTAGLSYVLLPAQCCGLGRLPWQ